MPLPTEAREGSSGLVCDADARQIEMASTKTDGILAVYNDASLCVSDSPEHALRTSVTLRYTPLVDRRTQHPPLSATIDKRRSPERPWGTGCVLQPCLTVGEQDSAADG